MKKLIVAVLMGAGILLASSAPARASGTDVCEIGISSGTNFVKCATTSTDLTFYRVDLETATVGAYVVCFDSAPATYATGLVLGNDGTSSAKRIGFSSMTATGFGSLPVDALPVNAANGVTCAKSEAGARARVKLLSR